MKNPVLILLLVFCINPFNYSSQEDNALKLKGVKVKYDYHEKITWIKSKPIPLEQKDFIVSAFDVSHIQIYFGLYMKDSIQMITPIRIVNSYNNSEWIFFDEISYLLGTKKDIRMGKEKVFKLYDKHADTEVKGGVTERSDIVASSNMLEFIKYIANKPKTRMECRYVNNRKSKSFTLKVFDGTKKLKKHFSAFLVAYNQIISTYKLENQFNL